MSVPTQVLVDTRLTANGSELASAAFSDKSAPSPQEEEKMQPGASQRAKQASLVDAFGPLPDDAAVVTLGVDPQQLLEVDAMVERLRSAGIQMTRSKLIRIALASLDERRVMERLFDEGPV